MGDPIVYQSKLVGYLGCLNIGKSNDGFLIRFENLDTLVRILSLSDSEVLYVGRECDEDKVTVGEFKKKYIEENGLVLYSSSDQELRHKGDLMTQRGEDNAKQILEKHNFFTKKL